MLFLGLDLHEARFGRGAHPGQPGAAGPSDMRFPPRGTAPEGGRPALSLARHATQVVTGEYRVEDHRDVL